MRKELRNAQLTNFETYLMYKDECEMTASNVFSIKPKDENLNLIIDIDNVNNTLLYDGSIAWFVDEVLGLLALPYASTGRYDVNDYPTEIKVFSRNGTYRRTLKQGEFVIMYDNSKKISILKYVRQYAKRLANVTRTIDINVDQQKTPRVWKTTSEKQKTLEDLLYNVKENVENVMAFEDLDLNDFDCVVAPAPFVADKVRLEKEAIWNEFLRFIGVANLTVQKKERNIKDEILASQGGTIASRFNRYNPRLKAIKDIKEKFGIDLLLEYYDGEPSSEEPKENENNDNQEGVEFNV